MTISFVVSNFAVVSDYPKRKGKEDIKELEGHLLYSYVQGNTKDVKNFLKKIKAISRKIYKRDKSIMSYWKYIDVMLLLYLGIN